MNRNISGLIAYIIAFFLQYFLGGLLPNHWSDPNLILCMTAVLTYVYEDSLIWMAYGCLFAFLADLAGGMWIGIGVLSIVITELLVLLFRYIFNNENMPNAVIFSLAATLVYDSLYWIIARICGSPYSYLYMLKDLPAALIINVIIMMVLWAVMIRKVTPHKRDRYIG